MSKKKMMSKQQRLYYEYSRKEKVREEIINMVKEVKHMEEQLGTISTTDPHRNSYFN